MSLFDGVDCAFRLSGLLSMYPRVFDDTLELDIASFWSAGADPEALPRISGTVSA